MKQGNSSDPIELRSYQKSAIEDVDKFLENYTPTDGIGYICLPTGSGKTHTIAKYLQTFIENKKNKVIWLAPEIELLVQAKQALEMVLGNDDLLRRIGSGSNRPEIKKLKESLDGQIFFSTIHAWHGSASKHKFKRFKKNLLIVVDEVHWGINGTMFKDLFKFCRGNNGKIVPILGLTATPRQPNHGNYSMVFSSSFAALVHQGFLAKPEIVCIPTENCWDPIFNQRGQISRGSLSELNSLQRNEVIRDTVLDVLAQSGRKGILFAVDVDHADTLYQLFLQLNIPCSVVHGRQQKNQEMIAQFRDGRSRLIIVVNMLIQGFDVPDITDVFLARPCESEVRISQMIGRGARCIPGVKERFWVYDFYDVIDSKKAGKIFHGSDYFSDAKSCRPTQHSFPVVPRVVYLDESFDSFFGIEFVDNQTFGIELEITSKGRMPAFGDPQWQVGAEILISTLNDAVGCENVYQNGLCYHGSANANACAYWRIESDSSAGWEVISPILMGRTDLMQLITACRELERLVSEIPMFHINHRCGFHLTLATNLDKPKKMKNMLACIARLEPGLFTLVSPSRLHAFDESSGSYDILEYNDYCQPLSADLDELQILIDHPRSIGRRADRYRSVNFTKVMDSANLLEVRMHNGTVNGEKIIPWIALWMALILNTTRNGSDHLNETILFDEHNPAESEDLFNLLVQENINITYQLKACLFNRRIQLKNRWRRVYPDKYMKWESANWYG